MLDGRIPLIGCSTFFIVEVTTYPFGNPVVETTRVESGPVELHQPATTLHLLFKLLKSIVVVQRVILFVVVTSIGNHDDRAGRVQNGWVGGPAIKYDSRSNTFDPRAIQQVLQ